MTSLVSEVRALLALFEKSDWQDLHVRTALGSIFMAKPGGAPNPMARAAADGELVTAPHVGTVVSLPAEGDRVKAGDTVCTLEVLGEMVEIASPADGSVTEVLAEPGTLAEYDAALVRIG